MAELRCSQLPLFMKCACSAMPIRNMVIEAKREFNDPAPLGTAVHVLLQGMVEHPDKAPAIDDVASEYNVDAEDLTQLYYYGTKCWPLLREHFGEHPVCEKYVEADFGTFKLTGHPDISCPEVGVDWKSGRVEYDASWQLQGGVLLCGWTRGVIVWLREAWHGGKPFEVIPLLSKDDALEALGAQVEKIGLVHTPGPHCNNMYCDRSHECEAYAEHSNHAVAAFRKCERGSVATLEHIAQVYLLWKETEQAGERFKSLLNSTLDRHGELDLGDGRKLVRTSMNIKVFDAEGTFAAIADLGVKEPARCFKVNATMLEQEIKKLAEPAGERKGAFWLKTLEAMEKSGALRWTTRSSRREKRG